MKIPARFLSANLSTVDRVQFRGVFEYAACMKARMREGKGLLLSGPSGVGKTWALVALTRQFLARGGRDFEFVTAPDLFERVSEFTQQVDEYRDQDWLFTYASVPWLVINDLGKEYRGGKLAEQATYLLGRVLRLRSESAKVTHVTTNLSGADLRKIYGESVISLLSEMTLTHVVPGEDRRRRSVG